MISSAGGLLQWFQPLVFMENKQIYLRNQKAPLTELELSTLYTVVLALFQICPSVGTVESLNCIFWLKYLSQEAVNIMEIHKYNL